MVEGSHFIERMNRDMSGSAPHPHFIGRDMRSVSAKVALAALDRPSALALGAQMLASVPEVLASHLDSHPDC